MLVEMSKVYIVGLKAKFVEVTNGLQSYGKLHITSLKEAIESGEAPEEVQSMVVFERTALQREKMRELASRGNLILQGLQNQLATPWVPQSTTSESAALQLRSIHELITEGTQVLDRIEPEATVLASEAQSLAEQLSALQRYEPLMQKIEPLVTDAVAGRDVDSIALVFERRFRDAIAELKRSVEEATDYHTTFVIGELEGNDMIAVILIVDRAYSAAARALLTEEGVSRIKLPGMLESLPFADSLVLMRERLTTLPQSIEQAQARVASFLNGHFQEINSLIVELENRTSQLDIIDQFGETRYTFVVAGYLPADEVEDLRSLLVSRYEGAVIIDEVPINPHEYAQVPVQLKNTGRAKWFEAALGIWGTPAYGTMDPTTLLATFFPFIFGFIVGDVGYGLLLFGLCIWARMKYKDKPVVQAFANVMAPAGFMTIVFGVFYFEFFGNLAHVFIPGLNQIPVWHITESFSLPFMRTQSSMQMTYLLMALAFGVFQVFYGLIIGMGIAKRGGHSKHLIEKAGLLTLLIAGIALLITSVAVPLTNALGAVPAAIINYALYLFLAVGFISALWGGGMMGAVETLEAVSHIASYLRIMAVGLVGALLADAANELMFVTMPNAVGLIIALILHVMNFVIICFSPTIHALRLNFLEFFTNFWQASKVVYRPFARKEG